MAKKITQKEVIQTDIWQNPIDSTKAFIGYLDIMDNHLKSIVSTLKSALGGKQGGFKDIKNSAENVEKLNVAFEQKIKIDKQRISLQKTLATGLEKQASALEELQINADKLRRERIALNKQEKLGKLIELILKYDLMA